LQLLRQHHDAEWELLPVRELREYERVLVGSCSTNMGRAKFAVCISNKGYAASLEVRKIYRLIPDKAGAKHGLVRVVDEMGEDYLFPEEYFVSLTLPQAAERAVLRATS
jgi:hypothetical protein